MEERWLFRSLLTNSAHVIGFPKHSRSNKSVALSAGKAASMIDASLGESTARFPRGSRVVVSTSASAAARERFNAVHTQLEDARALFNHSCARLSRAELLRGSSLVSARSSCRARANLRSHVGRLMCCARAGEYRNFANPVSSLRSFAVEERKITFSRSYENRTCDVSLWKFLKP